MEYVEFAVFCKSKLWQHDNWVLISRMKKRSPDMDGSCKHWLNSGGQTKKGGPRPRGEELTPHSKNVTCSETEGRNLRARDPLTNS